MTPATPRHCAHEERCYCEAVCKYKDPHCDDPCNAKDCVCDSRDQFPPTGITEYLKAISELRNALFVAANRYHDLKLRCKCDTMNELQFRSLVESALSESEQYKSEYETGDPLDWRRRNE